MTRGVYPFELTDPDFAWLLQSFREKNPDFVVVESSGLPVFLIKTDEKKIQQQITEAARLLAAPSPLASAEGAEDSSVTGPADGLDNLDK